MFAVVNAVTSAIHQQIRTASLLFRLYFESILLTLLFALLLRSFVFGSYLVRSESMLPTLQPGDYVLGFKMSMGVDLPFLGMRLGQARAERGMIVVLKCPDEPNRWCARRVIGLPGDRIETLDGILSVNRNKLSTSGAQCEAFYDASWCVHPIAADATPMAISPVMVPPGHVYLMNDQRSLLRDSRTWGPTPTENLVAEVVGIWLSVVPERAPWRVDLWRWNRLGISIDSRPNSSL